MSVDIEALAGERWFSQLTPTEQREALAELRSAEAFDAIRAAILESRQVLAPADADPLPRAADVADLRMAMMRRAGRIAAERPSLLARLLEYRVPAYQPALLAAAMVVLFLLWRPQSQPPVQIPVVQEKVVYMPVADTGARDAEYERLDREQIVQEVTDSLLRELDRRERKEGRLASRSERTRRPVAEKPPHSDENDSRSHEAIDARANVYVGLANLPQLDVQRKGKTFAEDSGAARFNASVIGERN